MSSLPHHLRTLLAPWNGSGDKKAGFKKNIYKNIYIPKHFAKSTSKPFFGRMVVPK
jgi:hypothetical protein